MTLYRGECLGGPWDGAVHEERADTVYLASGQYYFLPCSMHGKLLGLMWVWFPHGW